MATGTWNNPKWVKVWSNPSPASIFEAQTVPLDLSKYHFVMVGFATSTSTAGQDTEYFSIGAVNGKNAIMLAYANFDAPNTIALNRRDFTATSSGITFTAGRAKGVNSSSAATNSNNALIPVEIYAS